MSVIIRPVRDADLPAVGEVDSAARWYAYDGVLPAEQLASVTPKAQADSWSRRLAAEADSHRMLVAEVDGRIVGYGYVGPGDDPKVGDLYALFVAPDAHGTGVAQRLLAASLAELAAMGFDRYLLWVHERNERAIRFYERAGWIHDGTRATHSRQYRYPR